MEAHMWLAAKNGQLSYLQEILRDNPVINVNWGNRTGWTALHFACHKGYGPILALLLAHPDIDVNLKTDSGFTPFMHSFANGKTSPVRLMLKDSRVQVNEPHSDGYGPLRCAASAGFLDVIKWWIVSGREMDLGKPGDDRTDAIWAAKKDGKTGVVTLLERFKENPEKTRQQVRMEVGWHDEAAAEIFALVVFVSDGLLQVKDSTTPLPAARFFNISRSLPLELQMVLCYRVVGSGKEIIPGKDSEVAFKELAETLVWSSIFAN